jgi:hypothetical protein
MLNFYFQRGIARIDCFADNCTNCSISEWGRGSHFARNRINTDKFDGETLSNDSQRKNHGNLQG